MKRQYAVYELVCSCIDRKEALKTLADFKRFFPTRDYRVLPEGRKPKVRRAK